MILIPTLLFSISNPKSFLGQISAENFEVVHFDSKLAHMVYRGCWFLFRQQFFELPTLNPFLGKFGLKKSKLSSLTKNWHIRTYTHSISKMLFLILILVFSNFKPKPWGSWFLFWDWSSEIPNLNSFFEQISVKKLEFSTLPGGWYTEYLADGIVRIQSKVWKER